VTDRVFRGSSTVSFPNFSDLTKAQGSSGLGHFKPGWYRHFSLFIAFSSAFYCHSWWSSLASAFGGFGSVFHSFGEKTAYSGLAQKPCEMSC